MSLMETKLIHPFSMLLCGSTMSGKTTFLSRLLSKIDILMSEKLTRIIICYGEHQEIYEKMKLEDKRIELQQDLNFELFEHDKTLVVLDDFMHEVTKSQEWESFFTKGVHHKSTSVIFITQNLFPRGRSSKVIRINTQYYVIFKSPGLLSQISILARQLFPHHPKFLTEAYKDATKLAFSYLFINLHPQCDESLRLSTNILTSEVFYSFK